MYELTNVYKFSILARRVLDSSATGGDYVVERMSAVRMLLNRLEQFYMDKPYPTNSLSPLR